MSITKKFLNEEYLKCLGQIDEMLNRTQKRWMQPDSYCDPKCYSVRTNMIKLKLSALQDKNLEKIRKSIQRIEVKLK